LETSRAVKFNKPVKVGTKKKFLEEQTSWH